jgi:hypothetical protein
MVQAKDVLAATAAAVLVVFIGVSLASQASTTTSKASTITSTGSQEASTTETVSSSVSKSF